MSYPTSSSWTDEEGVHFSEQETIDLAQAWAETHELHPLAKSRQTKLFLGFREDGATQDWDECIHFEIHPDLTVTCNEGWTPTVEAGKLRGFKRVAA